MLTGSRTEVKDRRDIQKILRKDFEIAPHRILSLVGSGGKTSFMLYLASLFGDCLNIVITTTTKILPPDPSVFHVAFNSRVAFQERAREYLATSQEYKTLLLSEGLDPSSGKLLGIEATFGPFLKSMDALTLIEADGSRRLPLKWWKSTEPVLAHGTDVTLGILPLDLLGQKLSPDNFYELAAFRKYFSLSEHCTFNIDLLQKIVLDPQGLFKNSSGRRILVLTRCEKSADLAAAEEIYQALSLAQPHYLDKLITLSTKEMKDEDFSHYTCRRFVPAHETR